MTPCHGSVSVGSALRNFSVWSGFSASVMAWNSATDSMQSCAIFSNGPMASGSTSVVAGVW